MHAGKFICCTQYLCWYLLRAYTHLQLCSVGYIMDSCMAIYVELLLKTSVQLWGHTSSILLLQPDSQEGQ